ncbi:hypothetical protein AB7849_15160 [Rhodanobacter sp. 115]|uniref:hypothetical protein n=1 Tax=Rhodanobacter sp. FW021-MT20 TaxID=1162282 RepID=UPI0034E3B4D2
MSKPQFFVGRFKEVQEKHVAHGDVTFRVENQPNPVHLRRGTWRSNRGYTMEPIPDGFGLVPSADDAIKAVAGWINEHPEAGRVSNLTVHAVTS